MKYAILILPTLLTIGFVTALSTQSEPIAIAPASPNRTAEILRLHKALDQVSARLAALQAVPHNFLPRGGSQRSSNLVATSAQKTSDIGLP